MTGKSLLLELLTEELPPKSLKHLGEAFGQAVFTSLQTQGLLQAASQFAAYASPRRLAVTITQVLPQAAERVVSQKLMPVSVGLNEAGQPSTALLKKLASYNLDATALGSLQRRLDGKSEVLFLDSQVAGTPLTEGAQKALDEAIAKLPISKVMQYQLSDGWKTVHFVRPVHGLVALYGDSVLALSAFGREAGRVTHGHRFEAISQPISLANADAYAEQLSKEGAVIADFSARRQEIVRQLEVAAGRAGSGLRPIQDEALLDEVTALVERPNVVAGEFPASFLEVPQECLILTMKANQKYFPLVDRDQKLTNQFLVVSNISAPDMEAVVKGNERVVRPRLADAKFFFEQDCKKRLESRVPALHKVVYHGKLGTQGQRAERVRFIATGLAQELMEQGGWELNLTEIDIAAQLAKADLLTDMVGEFPELQGVMGGYYARQDGLSENIAIAIEDHYKPRFAGDMLPRNRVATVLALADKLETLVGLFGIGQQPSGDKDPYALRRHALGVIRMLIELHVPVHVDKLIQLAAAAFTEQAETKSAVDVFEGQQTERMTSLQIFIFDRLAGMLVKEQGFSVQEVDAILSLGLQRLDVLPQRLRAVRLFWSLPEAAALAAANKRVGNILKKVDQALTDAIDVALLSEPAELRLNAVLNEIEPISRSYISQQRYDEALKALVILKEPIDDFFDSVMVNVDDVSLRANRLAILVKLHAAMNQVADLSKLATS